MTTGYLARADTGSTIDMNAIMNMMLMMVVMVMMMKMMTGITSAV